jgi:hypothetical protein
VKTAEIAGVGGHIHKEKRNSSPINKGIRQDYRIKQDFFISHRAHGERREKNISIEIA